MYLKSDCPHCGRQIKKIGLAVIKPGIITCPACGQLSMVTGSTMGTIAYVLFLFAGAVIIRPIISHYQSDLAIFILIGVLFFCAIWLFSVFLGLRK